MNDDILNLEQATAFLSVSEKTLIKLLREEHIPARKIGREWRFSRVALLDWLGTGDSTTYINQTERYMISTDHKGSTADLLDQIQGCILNVKEHNNSINDILPALDFPISIPSNATLRIGYKQQRDLEKLEFKIYWDMQNESKPDVKK